MSEKRPPSRDPDPKSAGLWSTFEKAILGGWGPTLRLALLLLIVGGIPYAAMLAINASPLGPVVLSIFESCGGSS